MNMDDPFQAAHTTLRKEYADYDPAAGHTRLEDDAVREAVTPQPRGWVGDRASQPPYAAPPTVCCWRRRAGDREALAAIIFVATSGCTWRQLPPVFGPSWQTVYRRFAQWSRDGVWARLYRVILDELGARGELDWSRARSTR